MKSNPKKPKITGTNTDNDRLSSFPDSVLLYILSFVPTKYAARTSVLSKRWKNLFLDVSSIDLEDKPNEDEEYDYENRSFIHFVNRRLMLGTSSPITEFRLKCTRFCRDSLIDIWLAALLRRGIKVLEIEQTTPRYGYSLHPPSGFFQSKTLVSLKLHRGTVNFDTPESVCFPNLKVLNLESLLMHFKSKTLKFADGYPVLEDLSLKEVYAKAESTIEISLYTLKKLAVLDPRSSFTGIDIDTPHLQHFKCRESGRRISLGKCETLVSAECSFSSHTDSEGQAVIETLSNVNNVKTLHLDLRLFPGELKVHISSLPQFPNLNDLEFRHCRKPDLKAMYNEFLWALVHGAPNLKTLQFDMVESAKDILPSNTVPSCFGQSLRNITLKNFEGTGTEFALAEWLLNQGEVLESVVFERKSSGLSIYGRSAEWPLSTLNHLVKIAQLRPKCEILFT